MLEYLLLLVTTNRVTDLYAGAGNISIPLAQAGHTVTAVGVDPHLVAFSESRAGTAGVSERLTFFTKSCEKWVEKTPLTRRSSSTRHVAVLWICALDLCSGFVQTPLQRDLTVSALR